MHSTNDIDPEMSENKDRQESGLKLASDEYDLRIAVVVRHIESRESPRDIARKLLENICTRRRAPSQTRDLQ
jgi:hypothetical protein